MNNIPNEITDIETLLDIEEIIPPIHKPKDNLQETFYLHSFEWSEGEQGDYVIMNCSDEENEPITFTTGSKFVLRALVAIGETEGLNISFKFIQLGRAYAMVSPNRKSMG